MYLRRAAATTIVLLALAVLAARAVPEQTLAVPLTPNATATPTPVPPIPAPIATDPQLQQFIRADRSDVRIPVSIVWLTPDYLQVHPEAAPGIDPSQYLVFRLVVARHDLDLSIRDLKSMVYLREDTGKEYGAPLWNPTEQGDYNVVIAAFPRKDGRDNPVPRLGARYFQIVIRDLGGVKERLYRWDL